ncbi:MAG: collagenase [Ignavibacteria bacterium GWF2_33_9]|nr:MAG: collagenase [Ignavibacteria bacterium GWF2_33_9]
MKNNQIEIMSPVGSLEALHAAIQAGAGSVYFGVEKLNMRAVSSKNFTLDDLRTIAGICNEHKVKSYLTVNTVLYDEDLSVMEDIIDAAKDSGISAIIATDISAIQYAREQDLEIHISTQQNVSNSYAVKYFANFADVIVLARELNLDQVRQICDTIKKDNITGPSGNLVQIEMFIHGALCMAVSGKCYLSLHAQNHSANRGDCLQICRRPYEVEDKTSGLHLEIDNEYIMSPKDLATIDFLDQILDAGVTVLKIEGRGRSPEYVKVVTRVYHEAVRAWQEGNYSEDKISHWREELDRVYNRGFWDGYYLGQTTGEWTDRHGSSATTKKVYVGKAVNYYTKINIADFLVEDRDISLDDEFYIMGPTTGVIEGKLDKFMIERDGTQFEGKTATKGDRITFHCDEKIRENDKLYKIVKTDRRSKGR